MLKPTQYIKVICSIMTIVQLVLMAGLLSGTAQANSNFSQHSVMPCCQDQVNTKISHHTQDEQTAINCAEQLGCASCAVSSCSHLLVFNTPPIAFYLNHPIRPSAHFAFFYSFYPTLTGKPPSN